MLGAEGQGAMSAGILALLGYKSFLSSFENFINVPLFFFVPWSAINLVDYYLVKRGRCTYGRIQWRACRAVRQAAGRCGHLLDRRIRLGVAAIPDGGKALRRGQGGPAGGRSARFGFVGFGAAEG